MKFMNKVHEDFFYNCMAKANASAGDRYTTALFYTLGLSETTRRIIRQLYDFDRRCINPDGLKAPEQTGTSVKVTRLAFNLFTDTIPEETSESVCEAYTPVSICSCSLMPWMLEAIRIRFADYDG